MNRQLYSLVTGQGRRSLASLARAIVNAQRNDSMRVWRAFVMTPGTR
jgi:hypothetical protein